MCHSEFLYNKVMDILPQCKDLHQSADPPDRCWCFRTLHFVLSAPIRPITLLDTIISDNSVKIIELQILKMIGKFQL